jgi:hypothetical protein
MADLSLDSLMQLPDRRQRNRLEGDVTLLKNWEQQGKLENWMKYRDSITKRALSTNMAHF